MTQGQQQQTPEEIRREIERTRREPNLHRLVRYEDLCREPAHVIQEICSWLEVEPPPEVDQSPR